MWHVVTDRTSSPTAHGTCKIDVSGPKITIDMDGSGDNWAKSYTPTITVTEEGGSSVDDNSLKYDWIQGTVSPTYTTKYQSDVRLSTKSGVNGDNWYLVATASDLLGNTTYFKSKAFKFDNTKPVISDVITTDNSITFTATDNESGIAGWLINQSDTPPTEGFTEASGKSITKTESLSSGTYYIWVKDGVGNVNEMYKVVMSDYMLRVTQYENFSSSSFLGGPSSVQRSAVESVEFLQTTMGHDVSEDNCWDASAAGDESVLAWYEDSDGDNWYEVKVGAAGHKVVANSNSNQLFQYIGSNGDDAVIFYGLDNLDTSRCCFRPSFLL